jgi:uncharacterized protein YdiU (UPF0061 family)
MPCAQLADYVMQRHYPECRDADDPYQRCSRDRQPPGELIARWMLVGFIHGVMNTDNMAISGETIDYGPCAFMDGYHPGTVYSSIDRGGRYAYNQQPSIGLWNLAQLANCLLPLLGDDGEDGELAMQRARAALDSYGKHFEAGYAQGLRAKIGLTDARDGDDELVQDLLGRMAEHNADFTNSFRLLCDLKRDDPSADQPLRQLFSEPSAFDAWALRWRARLAEQPGTDAERRAAMRAVNPAYIPRNHRVQQAIDAATLEQNLQPLEDLLRVVSEPFEDHDDLAEYRLPPRPEEVVQRTFCGT